MITYNNNQDETCFDSTMIAEILQMHPSSLKRELKQFNFSGSNLIKYKNRHLISKDGLVDFILFLVRKKLQTDLSKLEKKVEKLITKHD